MKLLRYAFLMVVLALAAWLAIIWAAQFPMGDGGLK